MSSWSRWPRPAAHAATTRLKRGIERAFVRHCKQCPCRCGGGLGPGFVMIVARRAGRPARLAATAWSRRCRTVTSIQHGARGGQVACTRRLGCGASAKAGHR
jgi:hypothetical protein